jgi:hypothetical protein
MRRIVDTLGSRVAAEIAVENTGVPILTRNAICNRLGRGKPVRTERRIRPWIAAGWQGSAASPITTTVNTVDSDRTTAAWNELCGEDVFLKESSEVWRVAGYRSIDNYFLVRVVEDGNEDPAEMAESEWVPLTQIECTVQEWQREFDASKEYDDIKEMMS